MSYENIVIQQDNFCIAPLLGTFATVDTGNASALLRIKNDSGGSAGTYTFNPNIAQNTIIYGLEYVGPRSTSVVKSGMVFYTLESDTASSCTIKKWNVNTSSARLDLAYSYTKNSDSVDSYACQAFTVGKYYTSLISTSSSGTGMLNVTSTDTIVSGTKLYLGPSSNASFMNAFEEVEVTSVSGTQVYIKSSSGIPPFAYYNAGDNITYTGNTYLFSDLGLSGDTTKGTMYILDTISGTALNKIYSGLFSGIRATGYALPYYNTVGIVKASELLYLNINDYTITKSVKINNTLSDSTYIPVRDIEFKVTSVYRLQNSTTRRDDTGVLAQITWATFNYQEDGVSRYPDSMTLYTDPIGVVSNQQTINVHVVVRDQYGVGISGKVVTFDKVSGDSNGLWGEVNRQATTDINGHGVITYTSGWYDQSVATQAAEIISIKAHTDGSNILTGSNYVYTFLKFLLKAKYIYNISTASYPNYDIIQKVDTKTMSFSLRQITLLSIILTLKNRSYFGFPGGNLNYPSDAFNFPIYAVRQKSSFNCTLPVTQKFSISSAATTKQVLTVQDTFLFSQNIISRHNTTGNQDTLQIAQFKFLIDAVPAPYSYKNTTNTTIWVKLAPYGYSLDQSTLVFRVRELSYAGDPGYIDYVHTSYLTVTTFDAGGGLLGLEVLLDPPQYLHNNAFVYVYLEVYDGATPPNKIVFDYWFSIIADYNAPYVTNENPSRNALAVLKDTDISFNVMDNEVGVNIGTLELYVNNRAKSYTYTIISGGYSVFLTNTKDFYYEQSVEISIMVLDASAQKNVLYDMWRFDIASSVGPFIDATSAFPKPCSYGSSNRSTGTSVNVYDAGNGLDEDSIILRVDGITRETIKIPIIYRVK